MDDLSETPNARDIPDTPQTPDPTGEKRGGDALRSTFLLTFGEIVITLILVGQNRFLAGQIGPAGFGVMGLLQSAFRFVSSGASTWLSVPVTRWVSQYHAAGDRQRVNSTYTLAMGIAVFIVVTVSIIFVVFHSAIIDHLFDGEVRTTHFFLFLGIAAIASIRTVQTAILQAFLLIARSIQLRMLSAALQFSLIIGLVIAFGLSGLFISMLITLAVVAVVAAWVLHSGQGVRFVRPQLRAVESQRLLRFGGTNFSLMLFVIAIENIQRGILVRDLGIDSLGLMIAGMQIITYIDVVNRSAMFYWFPAMSRSLSSGRLAEEYLEFSHFNLYFGIPSVVGGMLFGGLLIRLLLGDSFGPLAGSIYLFMIWQFINLVHNPPATAIIALDKLRVHAFSSILSGLTVPVTLLILLGPLEFDAIGVALIAGAIAGYLPRAISLGLQAGIWGDRRTWAMTAAGGLLLLVAYLLIDSPIAVRAGFWIVTTVAIYMSAPRAERQRFRAAARFRRSGGPANSGTNAS